MVGALVTRVPIPSRMRHLERDPRGYPIPVMVFRDSQNRPHFTINGEGTRAMLLYEQKCSICGQELFGGRWFVGGPVSAFDPNGSYYDPPLHQECMRYAMRVCPYLALPSYTKKIENKTMTEDAPRRIFIDTTQDPNKPVVFVCVESTKQILSQTAGIIGPLYVHPERPYRRIEFWQHGKRIPHETGMAMVRQVGVNPD